MGNIVNVEKIASNGIVINKAYVLKEDNLCAENYSFCACDEEMKKINNALNETKKEILTLCEKSDIFQGHLMIVEDIMLFEAISNKIFNENKNAQIALECSIYEIITIFQSLDDEYMKERVSDIKDVGNRIMSKLKNIKLNDFKDINKEVIVIANDLTPSDTASMDLNFVKGFITQVGGITSHISIMAKNLDFPALVGVSNILDKVKDGDTIILDAINGKIIINPSKEQLEQYIILKNEYEKEKQFLKNLTNIETKTLDKRKISLYANVGNILEVEKAFSQNIDGIGLFRTEFLYLENDSFPTEEQQFKTYKKCLELANGKEIIIRTLDIGGDKELSYFKLDKEENPFLGLRGIRLCLQLKDIFKVQLRAILRASAFGNIKIMYPMIVTINELLEANKILQQCKQELINENINFNKNIKVGIMIETPATVILANEFAKYVDFFSIGTNDLTQYMLAVDRGNNKVSNLYNTFNPVVLRSIKNVIDAGYKNNINVCMCGEFASNIKAIKLLIGFGLDKFSISASQLNVVKKEILDTSFEDAKELANLVLQKNTLEEVLNELK